MLEQRLKWPCQNVHNDIVRLLFSMIGKKYLSLFYYGYIVEINSIMLYCNADYFVVLLWFVSPCKASSLSTNPGTQQFTDGSQLS